MSIVRTPSQQFRDELLNQRRARENAKSGVITISLMWNTTADLDLHVTTPSNEKIYYGHKKSLCGGWLDVDMNVHVPYSKEPIENVFWKDAPNGHYLIEVKLHSYRDCKQKDVGYRLKVDVNGEITNYEGVINKEGQTVKVCEFDYSKEEGKATINRRLSRQASAKPPATSESEPTRQPSRSAKPAATPTDSTPASTVAKRAPKAKPKPKPKAKKATAVTPTPTPAPAPAAPTPTPKAKASKKKTLATKKPRTTAAKGPASILLTYIKEAIDNVSSADPKKKRNGVSRKAIRDYIYGKYGQYRGALASKRLGALVASGKLTQKGQSFKISPQEKASDKRKSKKVQKPKAKKPKKTKSKTKVQAKKTVVKRTKKTTA